MNRHHLRLVFAVVTLAAATIVWAQGSGGPIGTMTWDSGYPKDSGTMPPTILGQGTASFPSGWSATGTISAFLPAAETDEYYGYKGTISFSGTTWTGTVSSYLPPGTYTVLAEANLTNGSGGAETVVAEIASTTVGGQVPKVNPGRVTITKMADNNRAIEASGTHQSNKGFAIRLGSFRALALPLTLFGNIDGTRKAVLVGVLAKADGTWSVTIPNLQPGIYQVWVGAEFVDVTNPNNILLKAAAKAEVVD